MTLGFLSGSKNFCKLLWVSCEVFVLHGYAWMHWVSPAPLHIGDCFEIRKCHRELCDLLSSSQQNFLHEAWLHHCVFCTGPLWSLFFRILNFGTWVKILCFPIPLFLEVPNLIHEKCLRVCPVMLTLLRPQDFLWSPPTILAIRATSFPVSDRCPHVFKCGFCGISQLISQYWTAGTSTSHCCWTWRRVRCWRCTCSRNGRTGW